MRNSSTFSFTFLNYNVPKYLFLLQRSYSLWLQKSCTVLALLYMRRHRSDFRFHDDALRTPIVLPLVCLCMFVSMLVISARTNPFIILYAVSMLAMGLALYCIFILPRRTWPLVSRINGGKLSLMVLKFPTVR